MCNLNELQSIKPTSYVLGKKGEAYVIYQKMGAKAETSLAEVNGTYNISWYNPRTGAFVGNPKSVTANGKLAIGIASVDPDKDWVVLIKQWIY